MTGTTPPLHATMKRRNRWPGESGFVLLNALIMVLALAGVAAGLMQLAAGDTSRMAQLRKIDQAGLYLDAGEDLVMQVLEYDWETAPETDHYGEIWAGNDHVFPIDRGQIAGQLTDLQGRFNLNWLATEDAEAASNAFLALGRQLDVSPQLISAIRDMLRPAGPLDPTPYWRSTPPVMVPGGPIDHVAQIRVVPGVSGEIYDRLAPYLAALPADSRLNVNTAPAILLASVIPAAGPRGAQRILQARDNTPFASGGDFIARMSSGLPSDAFDTFGIERFTASTNWFGATLQAQIDETSHARSLRLYRATDSGGVSVVDREDKR
ncbi:type II secretion system minor pseudopilin GspK [Ferrimonas balearica]|nr:type II secretion system minor pseudopilin GspK [Ferrimonas balearica]